MHALTAIAACLAGTADVDAAMPRVLEHAATALGATTCAVWWIGDDGVPVRRWGDALDDDARVAAWLGALPGAPAAAAASAEALSRSIAVSPIRAAGVVVGALVAHGVVASADGAMRDAAALADVIGPPLAHAAHFARSSGEAAAHAAEEAAHRRFMERVLDSLPVGLYVIDAEYRVQLWNHKRETDTHGIGRDAALGRSVFEVLTRQNAELMRREFDDVLRTGELRQIQTESRAAGDLRTYRLSKIPMWMNDDARPSHVITVGEDITEWKDALERTAQAEKLAAIGQLAAGVMHEINNPLATIAACAETMTLTLAELPAARPAPPGFAEYLRIVDHEVHRCRGIIDGLLDFSRAKPVQRVMLGANTIVEQTLFLLKHHARFKRYPVHLELADGIGPIVTVDPDQLTQVLMALLLNAADAIGEPTSDDDLRAITVRTREQSGEGLVEISDEGHGIARDDLTKIFEPFYTTKPPGAGTGLGLSICYGIVRDHGGRIEVESSPGLGSTFRVVLPSPTESAAS